MKRILASAGIDSTGKSNHSLRATAISRMFQCDVAEKVIMERSGHLSKGGLAPYQRTTAQQEKAACKVLAADAESRNQDQSPDVKPPVEAVNTTKPEGELKKHLQFEQMQGCTFNINVQL